jgi:cation diffusion facilitator family transporter
MSRAEIAGGRHILFDCAEGNRYPCYVDNRAKIIKRASWIGIIGNGVLAVVKVSIGLYAGSLAVIGDGIDSTSDIVMSVISLFTAIIIAKPPDTKHPFGHFRAETIATTILAFIMLFVGFELIKTSITGILSREVRDIPSPAAIFAIVFSIIGKIFLALSLKRAGKKIGSSILMANGKNMQNDIIISCGVLAGLVVVFIFKLPFIDLVLGIGISLWIMFTAFRIFLETNTELMDGVDDKSVYKTIFAAVDTTEGAINPHRTRVRKMANLYVIDIDIEVEGSMSVTEAHAVSVAVEQEIKKKLDNVYDIMVHIEPRGNVETTEKYGVRGEL